MSAKPKPRDQMTVDEFLAFTATRPDEERWELIEGVPHMNASPTDWHQMICLNIALALRREAEASHASWSVLLGIGTRVPASPNSLPQPDVQVLEAPLGSTPSSTTAESLVLFEILSKSNTRADQAWRKRVYASIPNLRHYVTVSQKSALITRFDRTDDWAAVEAAGLDSKLTFPALGKRCAATLREIYAGTGVR